MTHELIEKAKANIAPRSVTRFVVGHSVRFVVSSALVSIVPVDSRADRTRLFVGTYALSGMISDKATEWIDGEIDQIVDLWYDAKAATQSDTVEIPAT